MSNTDPVDHPSVEPTRKKDRILSLDAARGLAILGVFCVNVPLMALPLAASRRSSQVRLCNQPARFSIHPIAYRNLTLCR